MRAASSWPLRSCSLSSGAFFTSLNRHSRMNRFWDTSYGSGCSSNSFDAPDFMDACNEIRVSTLKKRVEAGNEQAKWL